MKYSFDNLFYFFLILEINHCFNCFTSLFLWGIILCRFSNPWSFENPKGFELICRIFIKFTKRIVLFILYLRKIKYDD